MKGTIKFYNADKGFGFIFCEDGSDIYFHINDWKNGSVPRGDDDVSFERVLEKNNRYKAERVILLKSAVTKKHEKAILNDSRIVCPGCGKKIVPRMITYRGIPQKSVCPYCAVEIKKFSGCFIATAVYEDYNHPQVVTLRKFRDSYLLTNNIGRKFVKAYYKYSPSFANYIKGKKILAYPIKKVLDCFIYFFKKREDKEK